MYQLKKEKNREINSKQTFQGVKVLLFRIQFGTIHILNW